MAKVLLADNDRIFLARAKRILEEEGHDVITASTPAEALKVLASHRCDVAILDYRLDDDSPGDRSGLDVAEKSDPRIPKIIVSDPAEKAEIMAAIRTGSEGLALVVRFLAKDEISISNPKLGDAVRNAIETGKVWKRQARENITAQLYRDYTSASRLASIQLILHFVANAIFVGLMVWASVHLHGGMWPMFFTIAGIVVGEIVNLLLAKGREALMERADRNHAELLQAARFEQLLAACDSVGDPAAVSRAKEDLIRTAAFRWIGTMAVSDGHEPPLAHASLLSTPATAPRA